MRKGLMIGIEVETGIGPLPEFNDFFHSILNLRRGCPDHRDALLRPPDFHPAGFGRSSEFSALTIRRIPGKTPSSTYSFRTDGPCTLFRNGRGGGLGSRQSAFGDHGEHWGLQN